MRQIDRRIGDEKDDLPLHEAHRDAEKDRPSNRFRHVGAGPGRAARLPLVRSSMKDSRRWVRAEVIAYDNS